MNSIITDVLVIGAGPAGTVAASIVNKAGFSVVLVEKEKFPRFVIGESLLPRAMDALNEAGFLPALKAKSFQEKFGAKFLRGNESCDFNFSSQFTTGWNWTWQVPRADFDFVLATETAKMGVDVRFETEVQKITFTGSQSATQVRDLNSNTEYIIKANFIIDASGYGRVIPRLFNLDRPSNLPPRKALFSHLTDKLRNEFDEPNRITVVVHKPGVWIWVIPFSNGLTSVGFVGEPKFFENLTGTNDEKLRKLINSEAHLKKRFANQIFAWEPKTLEGWSVTTDTFFGDGFVLTGNVTEFLDPIFSSGVTLAVASSQNAAHLVIRQLKGESVNWQKEFYEKTMQGVNTFRSYVMGWYNETLQDIFFAKEINEEFKNQICSVLAGYVWDETNPFVKKHDRILKSLSDVIKLKEGRSGN